MGFPCNAEHMLFVRLTSCHAPFNPLALASRRCTCMLFSARWCRVEEKLSSHVLRPAHFGTFSLDRRSDCCSCFGSPMALAPVFPPTSLLHLLPVSRVFRSFLLPRPLFDFRPCRSTSRCALWTCLAFSTAFVAKTCLSLRSPGGLAGR